LNLNAIFQSRAADHIVKLFKQLKRLTWKQISATSYSLNSPSP
jgi:hypothetical protein